MDYNLGNLSQGSSVKRNTCQVLLTQGKRELYNKILLIDKNDCRGPGTWLAGRNAGKAQERTGFPVQDTGERIMKIVADKKRKNRRGIKAGFLALCLALSVFIGGCSGQDSGAAGAGTEKKQESSSEADGSDSMASSLVNESDKAPGIQGLNYLGTMKLDYAECFDVHYYEGGYALIEIHDDAVFLVVPEGKSAPDGLDEKIVVISRPLRNIYLAATAVMAEFVSMDAMDAIRMSSIEAEDWTFDAPKEAMKKGDIIYAGKYSEPDYEMLLEEGCDLAIESTMIYHNPEVKEMIEALEIPVLVDRSSYEENPLARTEWIKLYGVLTGKEQAAESFFEDQKSKVAGLEDFANTEKKVAFFYVAQDGRIVVRSSDDYVPAMIEMAGGRYIFSDLDSGTNNASIPMSVEEFYNVAENADIIIYNGSIDSSVASLEDLTGKNAVLANMKAVKEGNCWVTGSSMYQRTDVVGDMIMDFHRIFTEDDPQDLKFISRLR